MPAKFFELVHHLPYKRIDVTLQAVLQDATRCRTFFRVRDETRQIRPVGDVKGLASFGIPFNEFQCTLLGLGIDLQVVIVAVVSPLAGLFTLLAGDIGIEYNFNIPLLLSLDMRPEIGFNDDFSDDLDFDIALGIRYQF